MEATPGATDWGEPSVDTMDTRPPADLQLETVLARLRDAGVRPTKHRCTIAQLLLGGPDRHVTAEEVHREAGALGSSMALATVYNTLAQLREVGLLRELVVEPGQVHYDTNTTPHAHIYDESTGAIWDTPLPGAGVLAEITALLPVGCDLARVDVVVRVRSTEAG